MEKSVNNAITIDSVSMEYQTAGGTKRVLHDVSYQVSEGHFVSIVGPSGVGKTTLLRLLTGLATPTNGSIAVRGQEPMVYPENDKPTVIALREIAAGFVNADILNEG